MNPSRLNRREFLGTAAGAATAAICALAPASTVAAAEEKRGGSAAPGLIDTNVNLGRWPFRRLRFDDTPALVARLRAGGVTQAWAGSFDTLFNKDISAVNARLAEECRTFGDGLLAPIGAINPMLVDWEEDLRRCAEVHGMTGIRLHPNYHGYTLRDPVFEQVLGSAVERRLFVQLAVSMEDERTLHPLVNIPATDVAPLPALLGKFAGARLQLLNVFRTVRGKLLQDLATAGVRFEIATLEGLAGLGNQLALVDAGMLLFGSNAPFYYFESSQLKLQESVMGAEQLRAISEGNARHFLTPH